MPATPRLLPLLLALAAPLAAQEPTAPATPAPATPAPPPGQVLSAAPTTPAVPADVRPDTPVTDAERTSIEIQSLLLDLHLTPAEAREEAHATLTLHNLTAAPLARIPLQLSSTLHWLSASVASAHGLQPIPFTQSPVATDADHTGYAEEAVFTPAQPLAPHATLTLTVVYGGAIKQTADRLELIGVPQDKALASDWDQIASTSDAASTSLRGFGNVLWYPCAAPLVLFGQGNQLFDAISRERRHNLSETMRLRLTVNYVGDPPDAVLFNGQLQALTPAPDGTDTLVNDTQGIATAVFPADSSPADSSPAAPIGLRTPSLFLTAQQPTVTPGDLLTVVTPIPEAIGPYCAAVKELEPLLTGLVGPNPRSPLLLLDHPGQPFEDGSLITIGVTATASPRFIAPAFIHALTHAWLAEPSRPIPPTSAWFYEGLPELASLLLAQRADGREAAIGQLRNASLLIALAEDPAHPQPLTEASADSILRLKSAFVFWQLRELLGEIPFAQALTAWRHSLALNPAIERDPKAFETSIERTSKQDLAWLFNDWVYNDPGLPDLSIVAANPRPMPAKGGKSGGSLVAIDVRNDGEATADVPVIVSSGILSATERLRIPPHSNASTRIVFEGTPDTITVNDGSVPELRTTTHTLTITPAPAQ